MNKINCRCPEFMLKLLQLENIITKQVMGGTLTELEQQIVKHLIKNEAKRAA